MGIPSWLTLPKDRRFWILLGGTLLGLVLAFLVKAPCLYQFDFGTLCYNDIQPLYRERGLDEGSVPYVDSFLEYPVLTGMLLWLAAIPATNSGSFFLWNAAFLTLFALGTTIVLWFAAPDRRRVALFAAGPPLVLYAFHNWDLLAVFLATLALAAHKKNRPVLAGAALALGAAAKIYPGFLAPVLFLDLWRSFGIRHQAPWRFAATLVGTWLLVNLPFMLANFELWWETYQFHIDRGANYESPWYAAPFYLEGGSPRGFDVTAYEAIHLWIAAPLFAAGLGATLYLLWRRRLHVVDACLAVLLLFLVLNKVFSVQYTLWILPFFALRPLSMPKFAALEVADVAAYVAVFTFLDRITARFDAFDEYYVWVAVFAAARLAALVWMLAALLGRAWRRQAPLPSNG